LLSTLSAALKSSIALSYCPQCRQALAPGLVGRGHERVAVDGGVEVLDRLAMASHALVNEPACVHPFR
jgi:hypothetical protein